jgi:hypothetical protein
VKLLPLLVREEACELAVHFLLQFVQFPLLFLREVQPFLKE